MDGAFVGRRKIRCNDGAETSKGREFIILIILVKNFLTFLTGILRHSGGFLNERKLSLEVLNVQKHA